MGTQCLQNGDLQGAIENLKKAVELGPEIARNHTNLSAAYSLVGEEYLAWVHARKAVLADYSDATGKLQFAIICERMVVKKGLDQPGTSLESIIEALGEPDEIFTINLKTKYLYGLCIMTFKEDKLVSCQYART